ncbi:RHS repeat domain-containing protein [Pleionea mediterranea]|uniref:RHS repeat-associated protein n=2 Tax=Pleionea mediterranea TaxID=523701 RepID=A0A316FXW5_9GAMM|nr:RHS repeat-associated core domain-containing protein [Pleionea mediterranea]PWK52945.1 RHS repeat-associated protein [Pleionea mediterranea]
MTNLMTIKQFLKVLMVFVLAMVSVVSQAKKETITFIHTDHLGSPIMATNEDGSVKWREDYQPFGKQLTNQDTDNNVGFTGHKDDKSLGLTYMQARWYHPVAGRFMSLDPIKYVTSDTATFNRYSYVANNPYNYIDPEGESRKKPRIAQQAETAGFTILIGMIMQAVNEPGSSGHKLGQEMQRAGQEMTPGRKGVPKKRGPKTDPNAPHNKKIREVGDQIEADGGTVIAGGGRLPEQLIQTPGGNKSGRRPDVLYQDCKGNNCGVNVGKTKADGSPIKREQQALDDLNGAGLPTKFERYN